jgi:Tfp pilus assembly protein PilN
VTTQHLNLLSVDLRRRRPWATWQQGVVLLGLLALLCLAAVPAMQLMSRMERREMADMQAALSRQREEMQQRLAALPQGNAGDANHDVLRARWQQLRLQEATRLQVRQVVAGGTAGRASGHAALLLALARQADPAVWLTGVTVSPDGLSIELVGRMADPAALPGYLERLRREPLLQGRSFAQLQLRRLESDSAAGPEAAGLTEFVLRSTLLPIATGTAGVAPPLSRATP